MNIKFQPRASKNLNSTLEVNKRAVLVETLVEPSSKDLHNKLIAQNIEILQVVSNTYGLASLIEQHSPDILILSIDRLDALILAELTSLNALIPRAVVVFAKQHASQILDSAVDAGVSSYVVGDVQDHRLPAILDFAVARFSKMQAITQELQTTKLRLADRKIIERAKGIIMQKTSLCEKEAYLQMRKSAMNHGQTMADLSRIIIGVSDD